LDYELGVTSLLLVHPNYSWSEISTELLHRSEAYLRECGAKVLYGGSLHPLNPFYLGLYGGSELPGILDSDPALQELYRSNGYREIDQVMVYRKSLENYTPIFDRRYLPVRHNTKVAIVDEPPLRTWWEACVHGEFDRVQYQLEDGTLGKTLALATLRRLDPPQSGLNTGTYGLTELFSDDKYRKKGYASYLLNEILVRLSEQLCPYLEAQTMQNNAAAIGLYKKMAFKEVNRGRVFRKE
jgi:GNAT superfamily N-acetyltransferase